MAKIHELLAVEGNLTTQANKTREDLSATFHSKRHLFEEKLVTFTPLDEKLKQTTEAQSAIQSTVRKEIEWISAILAKAIDVSHQIDVGNTLAKADIVTEDGDVIAKDVPATSLLQLEKTVQEILNLAQAIPTHDPAKGFKPDDAKGPGIYQANPVTKFRTKKVPVVLELAPVTKEHPRQTQVLYEDVNTGTLNEQEWTASTTPAIKSDILNQCSVLMRAIRKARSRANDKDIEVAGEVIGKKLLDYVFKPLLSTNGSGRAA